MLPKNQKGIIPIALILSIAFIATLTTYAAFKSYEEIHPEPSPAPIATPSPTPTPTPTATPTPTTTPKPVIPSDGNRTPVSIAPSEESHASPRPVAPKPSAPPTVGSTGGGGIQTERGNFKATVVTLPISARMFTDTASDSDCDNDCPTKPLADYVNGNGGFAGIHGAYACPADYEACAGKKNSFDSSVYNSRLNKWINEDHLGWAGSMIYYDGSGYHYRQSAGRVDGISAGIVNYPGLINDGNISVEGGIDAKQGSKNTKGGMGFNESNIFLVVAYGVDMNDFAAVFKALGAKYALNLDGGGSVAIYNGGYKAGPGRNLPNAIVFK